MGKNFSGQILRDLSFEGVDQPDADFSGAELHDVRFCDWRRGTVLDGASFENSELHFVDFEKCSLKDTSFRGARLHRVFFEECDLDGADFTGAVFLEKPKFSKTSLNGADFTGAVFRKGGGNFSGAHLLRTKLPGAYLEKADFSRAHVEEVIFSGANLTKANFYLAKVWFVNFSQADLSETNFDMADGLRTAKLAGANTAGLVRESNHIGGTGWMDYD